MSPRLALTLAGAALLAGCGPSFVPFTVELQDQYRLTDADVKNLQFYNSDEIVLRREAGGDKSQVTGSHKLLVVQGKSIDEVVIPKHTPGVVAQIEPGVLHVSFEPGGSFVFAAEGASTQGGALQLEPKEPPPPAGPNPFPGEAKPPPAKPKATIAGNYWLAVESGGVVTYQGKPYAPYGDKPLAHLVITKEQLDRVDLKQKVLPGVRLTKAPREPLARWIEGRFFERM